MSRLRCSITVLSVIAAVTLLGCESKQETPKAQVTAPPIKAEAVKSISGQIASGAVAPAPRDQSDAEAAAARVLAQMEAGEFSAMYQGAAPSFRQLGSEANFVAKFQQTRELVGPLKRPQETSFASRPDQTCVLVYHQENERFKTERRLTFARAKSGKMELFGLNQHDEQKSSPAKP